MAKEQNFAHPPRGHVAILAYDDVNNRWQVVECSPDGYLKTRFMDQAQTVLVQQVMPSLLQPGINTYDGSDWRKQGLIWSYNDTWTTSPSRTSVGNPTTVVLSVTVPQGYVYKLEGWTAEHNDTVARYVTLAARSGVHTLRIYINPALGVGEVAYDKHSLTLKYGQRLEFTVFALAVDKIAYLTVWGSKMKVAM